MQASLSAELLKRASRCDADGQHTAQTWRSTWAIVWRLLSLAVALALCSLAQPVGAGEIRLTQEQQSYALWPALTMLPDAQETWSAEALANRAADFHAMPDVVGSLGSRQGAVWLRTTLVYSGQESARWILHLDYAPLQLIEVFVLWRGKIVGRTKMGSLQHAEGPVFKSRSHAMPIDLLPGEPVELLMRLKTTGGMVLPLIIGTPSAMLEDALTEQGLQGAMAGLALGLLFYSLLQWLAMRDIIFLHYAIFTLGSLCFSLQFFGLGAQYLWGDKPWVLLHASGLSGLTATVGALLFASQAMKPAEGPSRMQRVMRVAAFITAACAAAFAADLISMPTVAIVATGLALSPVLLGLPRAITLAAQGNAVGATMLAAWFSYLVGNGVTFGLFFGRLPAQFWTLHAFQLGSTVTMLLFMRVLSLRVLAHRVAAVDAARERDQMRSLAHSDPLTGLANRRGLHLAMATALASANQRHMVAVYMIDLDGFKAINDEFGHDVGDALLVAVAQRLEGQVRRNDVVARLGGDEFVVMVRDSGGIDKAHMRGVQLLEAFHAAVQVKNHPIQVGMTIGYALAPLDGNDADSLLRRADEALYEGKQDGKFCVRRLTKVPVQASNQGRSETSAPVPRSV